MPRGELIPAGENILSILNHLFKITGRYITLTRCKTLRRSQKSQKHSATLTNEPTRQSMEIPTAWQGLQTLCFHTESKEDPKQHNNASGRNTRSSCDFLSGSFSQIHSLKTENQSERSQNPFCTKDCQIRNISRSSRS